MANLSNKTRLLILIILIISHLIVGVCVILKKPLRWHFEKCQEYRIIDEFFREGKVNIIEPNISHLGDRWFLVFLSVPLYYFLQSSFLTVYSLNLIFSISTILIIFFFLERFFDHRVAIITCLFLIFSNDLIPEFLRILHTRHFLLFFLSFLAIFLFYIIFFDKRKKKKNNYFAILGFLLGCSLWVHILIVPTIIFILFFWFVFDKKFFLKKTFIIFTIFLLIGSSLLIHFSLTNEVNFEVLRIANQGYNIFVSPKNILLRINEIMLGRYKTLIEIPVSFPLINLSEHFVFIVLIFSFIYLFFINYKIIFHMLKNIFSLRPTQKLNPETPLIFYMILSYLFLIFTNLAFVFHLMFFFLFIITSIVLCKLPKKFGLRNIGLLVFIIIIATGIGKFVMTSPLSPTTAYISFYTESCHDITGYDIASRYWEEPMLLQENCDKMDDNKYYCYKAAGNLLGQNILNLSLAQEYCEKLKFKEWCYEGLYEEIGSHMVGNLTVIKNDLLLHYDDEKWDYIFFPIDVERQNISDLKMNLNGCEKIPKQYKPFCYYGASKSWVRYNEISHEIRWDEPNNLREKMKICDSIKNSLDRKYCYVGFFKKVETSTPPYVTNPRICEAMGTGCDYFCYEGISKEIAFRYPNASIAERACQNVSNDETFLSICYKNIGYSLADRFRYNISQAHEYCDKLNESRESCNKGIKNFLEGFEVKASTCNLNNTIYVSGSNIVVDCNNSILKGSYTNKKTPPWFTGISIRNSNNITIRNCEVSNFTVNLLIYNASDVVIENVTLHDGFFRNVFGLFVDNIILKNVKAYNARDNSVEFSGDNGDYIKIVDSEIHDSGIGINLNNVKKVEIKDNRIYDMKDTSIVLNNGDYIKIVDSEIHDTRVGINLNNVKKVEIKDNRIYDMRDYGIVLDKIGTVYVLNNKIKSQGFSNGINIIDSNFVIDNSVITGQQNPSMLPPWSTGIDITDTSEGTLKNSEVQNYTVNIFLENSDNILIENITIHDSYFRNFFGRCINNIILKNITAYNAWKDNSIDFSDCYSRNIEITDSLIYNSHVGIRLKDVEKVKIKNTSLKNVTKCSIIIEVPPEEVYLEGVIYDPKCKVMTI